MENFESSKIEWKFDLFPVLVDFDEEGMEWNYKRVYKFSICLIDWLLYMEFECTYFENTPNNNDEILSLLEFFIRWTGGRNSADFSLIQTWNRNKA